jgi:hypothetical protein
MAGAALIFKYQWRACWRHFIRTGHRAQFYLTVLAVLGWLFFVRLPPSLLQAARELGVGQTGSMDAVLMVLGMLWLFVVVEDGSVSMTSQRLLRFPLNVGSLLGVRILSPFCSPVMLLISLGSLLSLFPLFSARHPFLGSIMALLLLALALCLGMSVSHLLSVGELRQRLLVTAAAIGFALAAFLYAQGGQRIQQSLASVALAPAHLVTAVAVAATPSATVFPFITLLAISAPVWALLFWSFRRSLYGQNSRPTTARATGRFFRLPGRLGGMIRKEQYYFRKVPDLWLVLLLALAASGVSLSSSPSPVFHQLIILIVLALNVNVIMNCLGLETPATLNRYAIFPLRGRDILLAKNLGLAVIVAVQVSPLILAGAWQSGMTEAGAEIVETAVLLLSHLTWGNLVSVGAPFKMEFYHVAFGGSPLTTLVGVTAGSLPGLGVILLHSDSAPGAWAITVILLLTMAAYLGSLHYAGKTFERRRHIIIERLS